MNCCITSFLKHRFVFIWCQYRCHSEKSSKTRTAIWKCQNPASKKIQISEKGHGWHQNIKALYFPVNSDYKKLNATLIVIFCLLVSCSVTVLNNVFLGVFFSLCNPLCLSAVIALHGVNWLKVYLGRSCPIPNFLTWQGSKALKRFIEERLFPPCSLFPHSRKVASQSPLYD